MKKLLIVLLFIPIICTAQLRELVHNGKVLTFQGKCLVIDTATAICLIGAGVDIGAGIKIGACSEISEALDVKRPKQYMREEETEINIS